MNKKLLLTIVLTLVASILPDIIFQEWTGTRPVWLPYVKLAVLAAAAIACRLSPELKQLARYPVVLVTIIAASLFTGYIGGLAWWQSTFDPGTFSGNFGGAILLKFIGIIPVIGVLLLLYRSPREVYLAAGDLSVKADQIKWLGIKKDQISWGKLSVISAVLIALGTFLLTIFTVTGFTVTDTLAQLISYLPLIILMALVNSFSEGIVYRNAVLGPLKAVLPKNQIVMVAAVFFGIAHYYGAPSGVVGVVMSGVLGWFMCRSMYETGGLAASWIIHFLQDVVIFSTLLLMTVYI